MINKTYEELEIVGLLNIKEIHKLQNLVMNLDEKEHIKNNETERINDVKG